MWRGFSLVDMMNSCFGNCEDPCSRGKQMPMVARKFPRRTCIALTRAAALRFSQVPLPSDILTTCNADTAGSRCCICIEA